MTTARDLRNATTRELREHIVHGHPVDPAALEGWVYRGTSLGLPKLVERFTWKTFQKTFWREPGSGRLLGWNVRLEQDGIDAPSRPKLRRGRPVTEWNYEVIDARAVPMPNGFDRGLIIDYSRAQNPPGTIRFVKDPLVALEEGNADQLLGVSYAVISGRTVETPTYFTLEREYPIEYVPYEDLGRNARGPLELTSIERGWAEELFAAIMPMTQEAHGLPSFQSVDRTMFWKCFNESTAPLVRAGLRPMVHTLTFLPVVSGWKKPFFSLSPGEREEFLQHAQKSRAYFVRQSLVTLKTLACFAYFDDAAVRARFDGTSLPGAE
jgi:hypothetical protein